MGLVVVPAAAGGHEFFKVRESPQMPEDMPIEGRTIEH
jgi:hypothetical protein